MTSSSFDKMLKQYQGSLPDISSTNYDELEDEYSIVGEVNKSIDALKADYAERTEENVQIAIQAAESRGNQLKALAGLVGPLKKIHDYHEQKKIANARYDKYTTQQKQTQFQLPEGYAGDVDVGGKLDGLDASELLFRYGQNDPLSKEVLDFLNKKGLIGPNGKPTDKGLSAANDYLEYKRDLRVQKKVIQKEKELLIEQQEYELDIADKAELTFPTDADIKEKDRAWAETELVDNFPNTINALLGVKKQFEGMDRPLSYLDVTGSQATADQLKWAPLLLQDAVADYIAYNKKLVDKIGENRFQNEIFPGIFEQAQTIHKQSLNVAFANAKEENKKTNAKIFANELKNQGITAITGKSGYVSIQELQADGTKNNQLGFEKTLEILDYAEKQGYISGREISDAINSDFLGRDGTVTNLETIKPSFYRRASNIAIKSEQAQNKIDTQERANKITAEIDNLWIEAQQEGLPYPSSDKARALHADLAQRYFVDPADSVFNKLKSVAYAPEKSPGDINNTLNYQKNNGFLLSDDLIAQLPEGPNKTYWEGQAKILGTRGLTKTELDDVGKRFEGRLKNYKQINDINTILDERDTLAVERAPGLYNERYEYYMRADGQDDRAKARVAASSAAWGDLIEALKSEGTEKENKDLWGDEEIHKYEKGTLENHDNHVDFMLKKGIKYALNTNKYVSHIEEQAILAGIEAEKNGDPIPAWFTDNAPYYNKTPKQVLKARVEATADLREGDSTEIEFDDKYHLNDISKKSSAAKVANAAIQGNADEMLIDLQKEDLDIDSTSDMPESIILDKPLSEYTIREILALRDLTINPDWNDNIGLGIYDLKTKGLLDLLLDPRMVGYIDLDSQFNEETQKKLMYARLLQKANASSSTSTWDNTYRRLNWLTDEEIENFMNVIKDVQQDEKYIDDPYRSLNTLTPEVAKVALEDALSYV